MRAVKVGIIGSGNVIWADFQVLDRLIPRGAARLGPVCARRRSFKNFYGRPSFRGTAKTPALASGAPGFAVRPRSRE